MSITYFFMAMNEESHVRVFDRVILYLLTYLFWQWRAYEACLERLHRARDLDITDSVKGLSLLTCALRMIL
jgi:hypothetical protein